MKILVRCIEEYGDCDCYCNYDKAICISNNVEKLKKKAQEITNREAETKNVIIHWVEDIEDNSISGYAQFGYKNQDDIEFEIRNIEKI